MNDGSYPRRVLDRRSWIKTITKDGRIERIEKRDGVHPARVYIRKVATLVGF